MKKVMYIFLILILLTINGFFIYSFSLSKSSYISHSLLNIDGKKISDSHKYEAKFYVKEKDTRYLEIIFNNNGHDSSINAYILNKNDKVIKTIKKIDSNNSNLTRIDIKNLKAGEYKLLLEYNNIDILSNLKNEIVMVNILFSRRKVFLSLFSFMLFSSLLIFSIFSYFNKNEDFSVEKKFLVVSIPIFILYLVLMPIFLAHDEMFHWYRIYEITEGNILPEVIGRAIGTEMSSSVYKPIVYEDNNKYKSILNGFNVTLSNDNIFISDFTMFAYFPVQYAPSLIGVMLGKVMTNRVVLIAYLGRLFNLIVSLALLYYAIKIIPFGKNILCILSLVPIAIEGFASLSGDGFTICISYLLISYILMLKESSQSKLEKKDVTILFILGVILAFCKLVYIPIVCLLFILPEKYFKNKKDKIIKILFACLLFFSLNLIWLNIAGRYLAIYTNGISTLQLKYILSNIPRYFLVFIKSFFLQLSDLILVMNGKSLLWGDYIKNYNLVPFTVIGITAFVSLFDKSLKNVINKKNILLILLLICIIVGLIYTSLYIQWTPYKNKIIEGVQGRYFLPFMPLFLIVLGSIIDFRVYFSEKKINLYVLTVMMLINYMSILMLFIGLI